ncbi:MAG TPA: MDR family oxidoreductase [Afifellaceae bacterium]|nr:MDR family oxidoreductase [Afifellaceae bacterium]
MDQTFKALLISRNEEKKQSVDIVEMGVDDLMEGDTLVRVTHSTVNYKDGLAITGKGSIIRHWPLIPGVDMAGEVVSSEHADFKPGDPVLLNGYRVGEVHYGAYAGMARVKGDWLVHRPKGFSAADTMAIGTAGLTSMLSVMALEDHGISPDRGNVVVTGAAGGVGSTAIAILSKLGYHVIASTGRVAEADYLKDLGAAEIIDRNELSEPSDRPLQTRRWAGGIDAVGSHTLANMLAMTDDRGAVAACGLVGGMDLPTTVAPFILRGVTLIGIESVMAPMAERVRAWDRLERDLDVSKLQNMVTTIGFDDIQSTAEQIVAGQVRGRVVVEIA